MDPNIDFFYFKITFSQYLVKRLGGLIRLADVVLTPLSPYLHDPWAYANILPPPCGGGMKITIFVYIPPTHPKFLPQVTNPTLFGNAPSARL